MLKISSLLRRIKRKVLGLAPTPPATAGESNKGDPGREPARSFWRQGLDLFERGRLAECLPMLLTSLKQEGITWPVVWRLVQAGNQLGTLEETRREILSTAEARGQDEQEVIAWLDEASQHAAQSHLALSRIKFAGSALDPALLREFAQKFGIDTFVETGTFMGETAATAASIFTEVHTIELSQELYERAKARFADTPNVFVHHGNSSEVLGQLLPTLSGRIMFRLDGHSREGITARGSENTPILGELQAIKAADKGSVILIDDIRLYQTEHPNLPESMRGYPTVDQLRQEASCLFEQPSFVVFGDTAIGFDAARDPVITLSPVLEACTISRMESAQPLEALLAAEAVIAAAAGTELGTLQALHRDYAGSEEYGLGGHYRLWNGLTLLHADQPGEAQIELERALDLGCNHWRVLWYLAQAANESGDALRAAWWLRRLSNATSDFSQAEVLWDRLKAKNPEEGVDSWVARTIPRLESTGSSLQALRRVGAWREQQPLRLHLGCGEQHLGGYINVDHPPSEHSIMNPLADVYSDLLELSFPRGTVDEIRLHHVFEHFDRASALGLIIRWHEWLKVGGKLHIETPDLLGTAHTLVSDASFQVKQAVLRHAFGTHEAKWAYHLDGWYADKFEHVLSHLGFSVVVRTWQWDREPHLSNVEAIAVKSTDMTRPELLAAADAILQDSLVADVASEREMHAVWGRMLRAFLDTHPIEEVVQGS